MYGNTKHTTITSGSCEFCEYVFSGSEERVATFPNPPETLKNTVAAAAWYLLLVINLCTYSVLNQFNTAHPYRSIHTSVQLWVPFVSKHENKKRYLWHFANLVATQTGIITVSVLKFLITHLILQ